MMKNRLSNNLQAKVVCFLIALAIWGYLKNHDQPGFLDQLWTGYVHRPLNNVDSVTTERHPYALFFDGECCFCNRWVSRLMKADIHRRTRFGAKQGATFQRFAAGHPEATNIESIVVVKRNAVGDEQVLIKSTAVHEAIRGLPRYALSSLILALMPRPLADLGYLIVSKNRKRIFGSQNVCDVVKPADRELFLD